MYYAFNTFFKELVFNVAMYTISAVVRTLAETEWFSGKITPASLALAYIMITKNTES
jgi:hypothetical protein